MYINAQIQNYVLNQKIMIKLIKLGTRGVIVILILSCHRPLDMIDNVTYFRAGVETIQRRARWLYGQGSRARPLLYVFPAHCSGLIDVITGSHIYGLKIHFYISITNKIAGINGLCFFCWPFDICAFTAWLLHILSFRVACKSVSSVYKIVFFSFILNFARIRDFVY